MVLVGPKRHPEAISKKIGEPFKTVSESAAFQSRLASLDLPYEYKGQAQLEKEIPQQCEREGAEGNVVQSPRRVNS
jgi:tripartite-type tricarboxylate transporter receptor subunit TctC